MQLAVVVLSRKPLRSPRTKECSPATCPGPFDKPERTAQPRLLARTGAAHAGRPGPEASPIQRALAGDLEKRTPGPRACQCRGPPLEGGNGPIRASRQRTGRPSRRRLGADSRPPRIVRHSPPGGTEAGGAARPSLPVSSGPVAVDAPLRENHADPRVHCALSCRRPTPGTNPTQSPHLHRVRSECLALRMRRLDVPY